LLQIGQLSVNITSMQKRDEKTINLPSKIEEFFNAGVHYGYGKSRRHPSVSPYIYTTKNNGDIIDLEKTIVLLDKATQFVKDLGARNKVILFVGTKPEAKEIIKNAAESLNMPYVVERWIGGTLSNFSEIKKRIAVLENYHKDSEAGGLSKYTKKERSVLAKKMEKLTKYYLGLIGLKKAPDAVFVIDAKQESIATTEAKKGGVPIIALINSDSNIKSVDYPIVGNDASVPSIKLFTKAIIEAYKGGQLSIPDKEA